MQLSNRLFFEQVEAMLAEGHEVQIRMKGHSMRPLLRSERDIAVLTPMPDTPEIPKRQQPPESKTGSRETKPPPTPPQIPTPTVFPPEVRPCNRATWCCSAAKDAISSTAFSASNRRAGRCPRNRQTRW